MTALNRTSLAVLSVTLLGLGALTACGASTTPSTIGPSSTRASSASAVSSTHVVVHVDRAVFETTASMCQSLEVVSGTVSGLGAAYLNTSTDALPANVPFTQAIRYGITIYTPVYMAQPRVLMSHGGNVVQRYVTVGGTVGTDSLTTDDLPNLTVGTAYVIVLVPAQAVPVTTTTTIGPALPDPTVGVVIEAWPIDGSGNVDLPGPAPTPPATGNGQDTVAPPPSPEPLSQVASELSSC